MKRLFWLFLGMLLGAGGALAAVYLFRHLRPPPPPPPPILTINGEAVSRGEFMELLQLIWGPTLMRQLTEQRLIEQEARRQKVSLTRQEEADLGKAKKSISVPE